MAEIYYIGGKIEINSGNIIFEGKNGELSITYNKNVWKLNEYGKINFVFKSIINLSKNELSFVDGDNIYIYNLDDIANDNRIYSENDLIFIGYNLKENKKYTLKEDRNYLITPSSKIRVGGGKIETDFDRKLIKDEKIIRNLLSISYGFIIRIISI